MAFSPPKKTSSAPVGGIPVVRVDGADATINLEDAQSAKSVVRKALQPCDTKALFAREMPDEVRRDPSSAASHTRRALRSSAVAFIAELDKGARPLRAPGSKQPTGALLVDVPVDATDV